MLVLFETSAGFALFKLKDDGVLKKPEKLYDRFRKIESARKLVSLKSFLKFENLTDALETVTALMEGKANSTLRNFLKSTVKTEKLAVGDLKLAASINKKLKIDCVYDNTVTELMRCIRFQFQDLLSTEFPEKNLQAMNLGLAHSLSRYKIKFSPDKVDAMIVQAVGILDDLDKELNIYIMRAREWYGYHFPELTKIVPDNNTYIRVIRALGDRQTANSKDLTDVVDEETAEKIKLAANISMGTEVSSEDMFHIQALVNEILDLVEYREYLWDYLKNRMIAMAPNLTMIVGELLGARLIAHAGSLMNLAKYPASTIQILGAEKALFRAIKASKPTPKYGYLYHASLVGQTNPKYKGKISRVVANKAALSVRVDALGDTITNEVGSESLLQIQNMMMNLENRDAQGIQRTLSRPSFQAYQRPSEPVSTYNTKSDSTLPSNPKKRPKINLNGTCNGAQDDLQASEEPATHKKRKRESSKKDKASETDSPKKKHKEHKKDKTKKKD
ncbi:uncharacterized protein LOC126318235 [Schistocerca gregaria]|uniref:uncharacterized protein LOC126318235 n=1 Tax=Schistocerca gregaria TaxID=7010 RepID=UPI00211E3AE0|nr:uncharacterized protein LOC126318235 [Schistocerca gregaria]